ncbi:MAG: hypothetical protein BWK73_26925 [Thiothrix lacustris]|uniref:Transporter n=1 Tax=Thiothrix lacustris TaxID=525917 RepID=A0A1Y1QL07_9GAMM|nr:MAG: hypothetical protein BWK73_26925 [Thiothrix lacustris]
MLEFWNTVLFSLAVTGPIFLLLGLGAWLVHLRAINDNFVEVGSRLVFTWALPALLFVSDVRPPAVVMKAGETLADMTLPLALLCTGASLDFHTLKQEFSNTMLASLSKLVVIPLLFTLGGWWWGFRGMDLGILLLMSSAPTAAASYVMARAMGGNATLAANTVALTTLGSLLTTSVGIMLLQSKGLM